MSMGPQHGETTFAVDSKAITVDCTRRDRNLSGRRRYLESAVFIPDITVATHATDGVSLSFKKGTSEGGLAAITNTYSSLSGGDGALTVGVQQALTLTAAGKWWEPNEYIAFLCIQAGSGKAVEGRAKLTWTEVP